MDNKQKKGGFFTLITIGFRNIWRNKRRTAFCMASVGISVFVFVVNFAMQDGMTKSVNDTVQIFETGHIRIVSAEYEAENENMPVQYPVANGKNWKELASSIHEITGVRAVFPRITTIATLQESTIKHAILWGIDIEAETALNHLNRINRDNGLVKGRYPEPDTNECAIGTAFARKAGLSIGDRIPLKTVSAQFSDRLWSPTITGIFDFDYPKCDEKIIIADFSRLQRLLTLYEGTQQLVIFADTEKQSTLIANKVQGLLGNENVVTDWNQNYWVAFKKSTSYIFIIAFSVILIFASFLIINTIVMIIHERIGEIGVMGSLGMSRIEIVIVFFFETLFLTAIGAFIGVVIGGLLTGILSIFPIRIGYLTGDTYGETPMTSTIFFQFSFGRILLGWVMGVAIPTIFTIIPSGKSAFIEPIEALRR